MPRRNKTQKQYGKPTEMMSIRVPSDLHKAVKESARRDRMPKSRKVVELLTQALFPPIERNTGSDLFD